MHQWICHVLRSEFCCHIFWRSEDPCPKASPNTRHSWHRRCIAVWNFQPPEGSWDEASLQSPGWGWEAAGQIPQPKMEGTSSSSPKSWRNFNWVGWETLIFHASRCWSKKRKAISQSDWNLDKITNFHITTHWNSYCAPPRPPTSPQSTPKCFSSSALSTTLMPSKRCILQMAIWQKNRSSITTKIPIGLALKATFL